MTYVKLDSEGNVEVFPYNFDRRDNPLDTTLPDNIKVVDTKSKKPDLNWYQKCEYKNVVLVEGSWVCEFTVSDRYETHQEKLKAIMSLHKMKKDYNQRNFANKSKQLLSKYPETERESWDKQYSEAKSYIADNEAEVPLLRFISSERGISVEALANKVINKADEMNREYGTLLGRYQKNKGILSSINFDDDTTWDNIDNIVRL